MCVELITNSTEIINLESDWRETRALGMSDIFTSPEWCQAAWQFLPELGFPRLLTAHDDAGNLGAVLPLSASRGGLVCAGSPLGDEHDVRIVASSSPMAGRIVMEVMARARDEAPLQLRDLRANGVLANTLTTCPGCPAPTLELSPPAANVGVLPAVLGESRQRHRALVRRRRELNKLGVVTIDRVTDPGSLRNAVATFVTDRLDAWRQRGRLHELPHADRLPRFREFLSAVAAGLARRGQCFLTQLLLDDRPLARALYFRRKQTDLLYMSTYEQEYSWYSASHLLLIESAAIAAQEGITTIELGRGDEPYKFNLGARIRYLRELTP